MNLETDRHKRLQVVLAGQPELRPLRQRLLVRCDLAPLSAAEVGPYLA